MNNVYSEAVVSLKAKFEEFVKLAEAGLEGRGSKTSAMKSRKLSNEITKDLKTFRQVSIENDKTK